MNPIHIPKPYFPKIHSVEQLKKENVTVTKQTWISFLLLLQIFTCEVYAKLTSPNCVKSIRNLSRPAVWNQSETYRIRPFKSTQNLLREVNAKPTAWSERETKRTETNKVNIIPKIKILSGYQPRQVVTWRKKQSFGDHLRPPAGMAARKNFILRRRESSRSYINIIFPHPALPSSFLEPRECPICCKY
jgi:hypothetical protein